MIYYQKLAKNLVEYACEIKPGERVLIDASCVDTKFLKILVAQIFAVGGLPFIKYGVQEVGKEVMKNMTPEYAKLKTQFDLPMMKEMDAYIGIGGTNNVFDDSDIPSQNMQIYSTHYVKPVHFEERVNNTKWVILSWPTPSFAQCAQLSTDVFEEMFFKVCTLDYAKMSRAMDALVEIMEKTDKVRIKGVGTDITFSIKGMKAIKCDGKMNIPDGEVYTAPIKDSVNGVITYNIPSLENGIRFDNISFRVQNGKIIEATAGANTDKLNEILNTDVGARFFGEFAIGVNPYITKPMLDTLFDEKICGSIHLTPGGCYDDAENGNHSAVHWDLVHCQLPECGGGEIWFDDVLVRKDGRFIIEELLGLNPENLI